ncbi:MAG: hypothetical protein ACI89X_003142, partial [Planctomycetota bacterium]
RLLVAYTRRELPGWGRVPAKLGGSNDVIWRETGMRTVRAKLHGFEMELVIANWSERLAWFLARYHDLALQQLVRRGLQHGGRWSSVAAA